MSRINKASVFNIVGDNWTHLAEIRRGIGTKTTRIRSSSAENKLDRTLNLLVESGTFINGEGNLDRPYSQYFFKRNHDPPEIKPRFTLFGWVCYR
tara:strand:- start:64166 stop:64450 length:285 start_codon:yes stop_codon:yes gene_type:complete